MKLTPLALWAALWLALLPAVFAQTSADSVLGRAVDDGLKNAANAAPNTESEDEFFRRMEVKTPVLIDRLDRPMQRLGYKVIRGFWGFYVSSWWQITVKSILVVCALCGLAYHIFQIVDGQANAGTTWKTVFFKLAITVLVFVSLSPRAPFVLTQAINAMVDSSTFTTGDTDIVSYHQQAFLRRVLFVEGKAAMMMNGRFENQFYSEQNLTFSYPEKLSVPDYIAPYSTLPDGRGEARAVTSLSFLFVAPPKLGYQFSKPLPGGAGQYLVAPPSADGDPNKQIRVTHGFFFLPAPVATLSVHGENLFEVEDPLNPGKSLHVMQRPFGAGIAHALRLYQQLGDRWYDLKKEKRHHEALDRVDQAAAQIFEHVTETFVNDFVLNQAFALTPAFNPLVRQFTHESGDMIAEISSDEMRDALSRLKEEQRHALREQQERFRVYYDQVAAGLARDFSSIKKSQLNEWTYDKIIPLGLLFCNAFIVLTIWLLPPLLSLWACFFLLPPFFEISTSLKRGAAVIVALVLYPIFLQLIMVFCFALADAANVMDQELDPNRSYAKLAIYGALPSAPGTGGGTLMTSTAVKTAGAFKLADMVNDANAGLGTMASWIVILLLLVSSMAVVAKFIMGVGAADALAQPVQTGLTMGATMGIKSVLGGVSAGVSDASALARGAASSLSRRIPR